MDGKDEMEEDDEQILHAFNSTIQNIAEEKSKRLSVVEEEISEQEREKQTRAMIKLDMKKVSV